MSSQACDIGVGVVPWPHESVEIMNFLTVTKCKWLGLVASISARWHRSFDQKAFLIVVFIVFKGKYLLSFCNFWLLPELMNKDDFGKELSGNIFKHGAFT